MIFKIRNTYLSVSWYFLAVLLWAILTSKVETFILCFASLVIHEMGHIVAINMLKEKINIFYILPFGFCCRLKNQSKIKKENMLKILIAGPATSIVVAGLFLFWTKEFALVNLVVGLFNLLPFGKLDGGRILPFIFQHVSI